MSLRKDILENGEIYHIFNRSIQKIPLFSGQRECDLFLESAKFYLQPNPPVRFSLYRQNRERYKINLQDRLVTIITYNLMPNHFHFALRQERELGIQKFIQKVSNSFAHYFNLKYHNHGPLFETNYKARYVETDQQLAYLSSYIHLNPVTAHLVENPEDWEYSSYGLYLRKEKSEMVDPSLVLNQFGSVEKYQEFVMSHKKNKKELEKINDLLIENEHDTGLHPSNDSGS